MADKPFPRGSRDGTFLEKVRYWLSVIPGTKRDYFFISIALIDVILIMFSSTYIKFIPEKYAQDILTSLLIFDYTVMSLWGLEFLRQLSKQENKWDYLTRHWYEVLGLIPLSTLRPFLLARALKLGIAYYKIGKSETDVSRLLTQEITFRFRDVIVDTISDAVFLQSLRRVEEVMLRLDYQALAREIIKKHEGELRDAIINNVQENSLIGDLSNIPLMGPIARSVGSNVADSVLEVMQEEALGKVFHDVTAKILSDMHISLRELDVLRITRSQEHQSPLPEENEATQESIAPQNTEQT